MANFKYEIYYKGELIAVVGYGSYADITAQALAGHEIIEFRGKEYDSMHLDIKEVLDEE